MKEETITCLTNKVLEISGKSNEDLNKYCWMIVHEHIHGVMPSEYDIREIDEELYLAIMKRVRELKGIA